MISKSQPTHDGTPQAQSVIIVAIALFAFSGLMVGFAVGAFVRPAKPSTGNIPNQTQIIVNHITPTTTPDPTPTTAVFIHLGCPAFTNFSSTTNANGMIEYSVALQARDKTGEVGEQCNVRQEKPITDNGVTCRIWLVSAQTVNVTDDLRNDTNQLQNTNTFNQQFPHEIQNGLTFNPSTLTETQPCAQGNGSAQWKFTIAPSVTKGDYYLVGLTDWQGKSWNWSWNTIAIGNTN
jgi:hypothetical protein